MPGCRKIYSNLLLLSVILFSLGGAVRPVIPGWDTECCHCAWCEPDADHVFQWEAANSPVVYRHVHASGLLGGAVTEIIRPETVSELHTEESFTAFYTVSVAARNLCTDGVSSPRAPPEA